MIDWTFCPIEADGKPSPEKMEKHIRGFRTMTADQTIATQKKWIDQLRQENSELLAALVSVCKQLHETQKAVLTKNELIDSIRKGYHEMDAKQLQEHIRLTLI